MKEIIKITEINEIENKQYRRSMKLNCFFENINKTDKSLSRLFKKEEIKHKFSTSENRLVL